MGRLINVPQEKIQLIDKAGNVVATHNYFWLIVPDAIVLYSQRLKGIELFEFNDFYQIIKSQKEQKTLTFGRDSDYEKLKTIMENHSGWIGNNAPESATIVLTAIREAEKYETPAKKADKPDKK